jgi:murein DD-endopeptidase MepM/ murein hydrolase activator NlpD
LRDKLPATRLGRPVKKLQKLAPGGIRPRLFYGVFAALFATNVVAVLALLMSPDISALLRGQTGATVAAYQDRIDQLRLEIDRLHSRQFARTGDINIELQELAQQQEVLAEQHLYVKALADKAAQLGIAPIATPASVPVPLVPLNRPGTTPAANLRSDAGAAAVEQAGHQVRQMMDESRTALATISAEATSSTDQILAALTQVGIRPAMLAAGADGDAMGGPLLPPETGADSSMVDEANDVVTALTRFQQARAAIADAPIHLPVTGSDRVSSGFGNRTDPFTGRLAFHPGIDFPWPQGTAVMAAGGGKVIFVGQINGYGNVIDIDHGGGIVTRYGHLSAFIATQGEEVETGMPVGRVGSTGRSTGPHLHFEVRRNDQPVDPTFYLAVGKRLAHFLKPSATAVAATGGDAIAPAAGGGAGDDSDAG